MGVVVFVGIEVAVGVVEGVAVRAGRLLATVGTSVYVGWGDWLQATAKSNMISHKRFIRLTFIGI